MQDKLLEDFVDIEELLMVWNRLSDISKDERIKRKILSGIREDESRIKGKKKDTTKR